MDQQQHPPPHQARRDQRWERNRRLLHAPHPERLDAPRRIIWRELNRANSRRIARLFLWWLAVNYLVIGATLQLRSLWLFSSGTSSLDICVMLQALLATWTLNGVYLLTLLSGFLCDYTPDAWAIVLIKWLTLAVPACFPLEYLVFYLALSFNCQLVAHHGHWCPLILSCSDGNVQAIILIQGVIVALVKSIPFGVILSLLFWPILRFTMKLLLTVLFYAIFIIILTLVIIILLPAIFLAHLCVKLFSK